METIVGSPRSSSGYGSSEEDHGPATINSTCSTPQTPDSLSIFSGGDKLSVFGEDDIIPDFSDLGTLTDTGDLSYLANYWSDGTTPDAISSPDNWTLGDFTAEDVERVTQETDTSTDNANVLVSLLTEINADLNWCPIGSAATSDNFDGSMSPPSCIGDPVSPTELSAASSTPECQPETVRSTTSPLQRLKALTQGSVVNNTELPRRPRVVINSTPNTTSSAAAASNGLSCQTTVIRVGVVESVSNKRSVSSSVASAAVLQGKASISGIRPFFAVSSANSELKTNISSCTETRPRKQFSPANTISSAGCTKSATVAVRRQRSELDDHRYSSLLPVPMTSSTAARRPTNSSANGSAKRLNRSLSVQNGAGSVAKTMSGRRAKSSMLETLLLTNKTLRPNEGSEASLAACGVSTSSRRSSLDSSGYLSSSGPQPKRTCSDVPGSLLEHLLTGRTVKSECIADEPVETVIPKTEIVEEEDIIEEKFTVGGPFSDQLACDYSHSMNLGGLFGEDMSSAWAPTFSDDLVCSVLSLTASIL